MLWVLGMMIIAVRSDSRALVPVLFVGAIILCLIIGTVVVLVQRFKEINGGEEYDARKY